MNEDTIGGLRHDASDDAAPHLSDELSLDGTIAGRTLPRIAGTVLAASLLFAGSWSMWGPSDAAVDVEPTAHRVNDTAGKAAESVWVDGGQRAFAAAPPCYATLEMLGAAVDVSSAQVTGRQLHSCVRHLRALEHRALRAWAERDGTAAHRAGTVWRSIDCLGIPASADAASHWLAAGYFPNCGH